METTLTLRRILGALGICMPIVLWVCGLITGSYMPSISNTHYEPVFLIFEGTVVVVGWFLIAYKGYDIGDRVSTIIAGISALLLSYFPTKADDIFDYSNTFNFLGIPSQWTMIIHYSTSLIFFFTLAYISFFRFTKTGQNKPTKRKEIRNRVYKAMGCLMIIFILLGGAIDFILVWLIEDVTLHYPLKTGPLFIGEALGLICFGISWLIKGETILKDN